MISLKKRIVKEINFILFFSKNCDKNYNAKIKNFVLNNFRKIMKLLKVIG